MTSATRTGGFNPLEVGGEAVRVYASGAVDADAVVLFHPWWGLNDDVTAFADRLAGAGFRVLAPDLVREKFASTVEEAERLVAARDEGHADAVTLAAIDELVRQGRSRIGVVGFSFGAAWAIWCAAKRPEVAGTVVYYGTSGGPSVTAARVPVMGHFAEDDPYEPDDQVRAFERTLSDAGRRVELHRYAGAGHWFAEPSRDAWRPADADLAFERTVIFLRGLLGG